MSEPCPSSESLQQFLDEKIEDQSRQTAIVDHVEDCDACQERMESLLAGIGFSTPTNLDTSTESSDASVEELIDRLTSSPPKSTKPEASLSGSTLGAYLLKEPIGHGTTGVVYRALDKRLRREVAVKVLRNDFANSDRARTRLEREAQAAAMLKQPHVVSVYDVCIDPIGISYLVMELVEGGTLKDKIRSEGPMSQAPAIEIAQQLLLGLQAAHNMGLVHRDLKSSNVLLKSDSQKGLISKLSDFGLVRDLESDSNLTRENVIAGTPAYMSPEQVLSPHDVDRRADIYSLGVVLYELLAGELPFRGIDRMVLKQVVHDDPKSLCRLNDSITRDLETICNKALSKSPDSRYQTALEMHDDLQRCKEGKPIVARRIGPIAKAWNWSRRNPAIAALLALSISLLSVLTVGSMISAVSIRTASLEQERLAVAARRQRDESLETIRKLIFEVNESLEPGTDELDLDATQMKLLLVALDGIEKIEQFGEDAGLIDVSRVAAKNRLGDVYYRLDRIQEAYEQFSSAIELSENMSGNEENRQVFHKERLRAFEGIASFFNETDDELQAEAFVSKANAEAKLLSQLTGKLVEPVYYTDMYFALDEETLTRYKSELEEHIHSPPKTVQQVDDASELTQSLGYHFMDVGELAESKSTFRSLLAWLEFESSKTHKPKFVRAVNRARHSAHYGLADVAAAAGDERLQAQQLRQSLESLKVDEEGFFHRSAEESAAMVNSELLDILNSKPKERWMTRHFKMDHQFAQLYLEDFPEQREMQFEVLETEGRWIRVMYLSGDKTEAKRLYADFETRATKLQEDFDESAPENDEFVRAAREAFELELELLSKLDWNQ